MRHGRDSLHPASDRSRRIFGPLDGLFDRETDGRFQISVYNNYSRLEGLSGSWSDCLSQADSGRNRPEIIQSE